MKQLVFVVWQVWSILATLGLFGFSLRILAPVTPAMGGTGDLIVWGLCAATLCANLVAGIVFGCGAYGDENLQSILRRQDP